MAYLLLVLLGIPLASAASSIVSIPVLQHRRVVLHRVGELTNGLEYKVHRNDTVLNMIRAFLLAFPTNDGHEVEPSEAPATDPHNENYHRLYDEQGTQIRTADLGWLLDGQRLFICKPERWFMWPPYEIGTRIDVQYPPSPDGASGPIQLEVLSHSPLVFLMRNFLSEKETQFLIENNKNRMKRSTIGIGDIAYMSGRTSYNSWEVESRVAMAINERAFDLTRVTYKEAREDGVQVLRYHVGERYESHKDFFEPRQYKNADTALPGGTNRFASIFVIMRSPTKGGQTVFPNATSAGGQEHVVTDEEWKSLPEHAQTMSECTNTAKGLHVKPAVGDAILFYNQLPSGALDERSLHGGCPVVEGEKWAANVWIWSGSGVATEIDDVPKQRFDKPFKVTFGNALAHPIHLLFVQSNGLRELFVENMESQTEVDVNTFLDHVFEARNAITGEVVGQFLINQYRRYIDIDGQEI